MRNHVKLSQDQVPHQVEYGHLPRNTCCRNLGEGSDIRWGLLFSCVTVYITVKQVCRKNKRIVQPMVLATRLEEIANMSPTTAMDNTLKICVGGLQPGNVVIRKPLYKKVNNAPLIFFLLHLNSSKVAGKIASWIQESR